jgi:hypothetical protein
MKRISSKKIAILFLIAAVGLSSCRRDEPITELSLTSSGAELDVRQIREFVTASKKNQGTENRLMSVSSDNTIAPTIKPSDIPNFDMDWDNAFTHNNSVKGFPVIMVPLKNNNVNRSIYPDMNPKGYRLIAFQHNDEKEIKWQIFEVHPDVKYVKVQMMLRGVSEIGNEYSDYAKILNKKFFSGYVFIFHATGPFLRGYHMTDGVYDKKLEPKLN